MSQAESEKLDALIFIDTNIFLDFYRYRNSEVSLELLPKINQLSPQLILTNQVEMEFKKNRQAVILSTVKEFDRVDGYKNILPPIVNKNGLNDSLKELQKEIKLKLDQLKKELKEIYQSPLASDNVYKTFDELCNKPSDYRLTDDHKEFKNVLDSAQWRYSLGYPPRKFDDISFGDALNWEWIIHCAKKSNKDIIIVSRDNDFGYPFDKKDVENSLNDWLLTDFNKRVGTTKKIILTQRLTYALKSIEISVSKEAYEFESKIIDFNKNTALVQFKNKLEHNQKMLRHVVESFNSPFFDFQKAIENQFEQLPLLELQKSAEQMLKQSPLYDFQNQFEQSSHLLELQKSAEKTLKQSPLVDLTEKKQE